MPADQERGSAGRWVTEGLDLLDAGEWARAADALRRPINLGREHPNARAVFAAALWRAGGRRLGPAVLHRLYGQYCGLVDPRGAGVDAGCLVAQVFVAFLAGNGAGGRAEWAEAYRLAMEHHADQFPWCVERWCGVSLDDLRRRAGILAPPPPAAPAAGAARGEPRELRAGCRVEAEGLRLAAELNGERGTVTGRQGDRWVVEFDCGRSEELHMENLHPLAPEGAGTLADLLGHDGPVCRQYNGGAASAPAGRAVEVQWYSLVVKPPGQQPLEYSIVRGTAFGPTHLEVLDQELVMMEPLDGCSPLRNAVAVQGKIAVCLRGSCTFAVKIAAAARAGATGIIVVNNDDGNWPFVMDGADLDIEETRGLVPAFMISQKDGRGLRELMTLHGSSLSVSYKIDAEWHSFRGGGDGEMEACDVSLFGDVETWAPDAYFDGRTAPSDKTEERTGAFFDGRTAPSDETERAAAPAAVKGCDFPREKEMLERASRQGKYPLTVVRVEAEVRRLRGPYAADWPYTAVSTRTLLLRFTVHGLLARNPGEVKKRYFRLGAHKLQRKHGGRFDEVAVSITAAPSGADGEGAAASRTPSPAER